MAIAKNAFSKYAESRENSRLSEAMEKKKYSHHRVFDNLDDTLKKDDLSEASNSVFEIDPLDIENWEYSDRTEASFGDISGLANEFIKIGQQQPCLVRVSKRNNKKYELILGERRWRAAKEAKVNLLVIIKDIDDTSAALSQVVENESRENLSDYEKGISFSKLIENKVIKQKDLTLGLGRSKQYVSALLSFSKIPQDVLDAIGDITKFNAVAAERIKQISSRSEEYKTALLSIGHKFKGKSPKVGQIEKEISMEISKKDPKKVFSIRKLYTKDGRHVGTWRPNNNHLPSLNLPLGIATLIESEQIDFEALSSKIIDVIESELDHLRK